MLFRFGGSLTNEQRDALLKVAPFWTRNYSTDQLKMIMVEILGCFEYWKSSQTDKAGRVKVFQPFTAGVVALKSPFTWQPTKDVPPWRCAGPFVQNELDSAFKLWLESDPLFDAIIEKYGTFAVLALCGARAARREDVDPASLIRLNGLLGEHLALYADSAAEWILQHAKSSEQRQRQDEGLKTAREVSAQKRSERAKQQHENIRRMAFEYFRSRPADSVEAAIAHIGKYVQLSHATIMATIKGVRAAALRSLNRDAPKE